MPALPVGPVGQGVTNLDASNHDLHPSAESLSHDIRYHRKTPRKDDSGMLATIHRNVRARPITTMALLSVGGYSLWLGAVIHYYTMKLAPVKLTGYHGPLQLASLDQWSYGYLLAGILMLARICLLNCPRADLLVHVLCMIPIVAWAVAFDVGPATTGQPAYTLVAAILVMIPFITKIAERWVWSGRSS